MKLHLKARIIIGGTILVTASIAFAMLCVYSLIWKQNYDAAKKRIDQTAKVVAAQYKVIEIDFLKNGERLSSNNNLISQFLVLKDVIEQKEDLGISGVETVRIISDQIQAMGIERVAAYSEEGKWVAAVTVEGGAVRCMFAITPGEDEYKESNSYLGEKIMERNFKVGSGGLNFNKVLTGSLPEASDICRKIEAGDLWLQVSSPIYEETSERKNRLGYLIMTLKVKDEFVRRMFEYTGAGVNLFIGRAYNAGEIKEYQKLDDEGIAVKTVSRESGVDVDGGVIRKINVGSNAYFEGLYVLVSHGEKLGTLSILFPQSETQKNVRQMLIWLVGIAVACLAIATPLTWYAANSIANPINLTIQGLTFGAQKIQSASNLVTGASRAMAESLSSQAATTEEASGSLEEMSSMTKKNADSAREAKEMIREAERLLKKVSSHMADMKNAIEEISKTSEATGKIIKTVDEIAFQTNLLALNAAVEAARAGVAGAGFAVVADEVRRLAMRASEAAQNTEVLIKSTIIAVSSGIELTDLTQKAFEEHTVIANKIGLLVDGISEASQEQAQGVEHVNTAIIEIDNVSQINAANSEESAAASIEMDKQAVQIHGFVKDLVRVVQGVVDDQYTAADDSCTEEEKELRADRKRRNIVKAETKRISS